MSNTLASTFGVNVHLADDTTAYAQRWPEVLQLMRALGVAHVRSSAWPNTYADYPRIHQSHLDLVAAGMQLDLLWDTKPEYDSALLAQLRAEGLGIYNIEAPNELDLSGKPNWVAQDIAALKLLCTQWPAVSVIAPSVTTEAAAIALGDCSPWIVFGNLHQYYGTRPPETPGWGGTDKYGTYGSLEYGVALAKIACPKWAILVTETGYDASVIPEPTLTQWHLRTMLYHYAYGIERTYFYQMVQGGGDAFSRYGLVDATLGVTASYTALKNLIAMAGAKTFQFSALPGSLCALTALDGSMLIVWPVGEVAAVPIALSDTFKTQHRFALDGTLTSSSVIAQATITDVSILTP